MLLAFLRGKSREELQSFLMGKDVDVLFQSLDEHIKQSMNALNEIKKSKLWMYYLKLFSNGEQKLAQKLAEFSVKFHDAGKTFYKWNVEQDEYAYISFRGHEYLSAYILDEVLSEGIRLLNLASIAAVLYHHHAMNLKSRIPDRIRVCPSDEFKILEDEFKQIFGTGIDEEIKRRIVEKQGYLFLDNAAISFVKRHVDELNRSIWSEFAGNAKFRKIMLVLTVIVISCDYLGARGRGWRETTFSRAISDMISCYANSHIFL